MTNVNSIKSVRVPQYGQRYNLNTHNYDLKDINKSFRQELRRLNTLEDCGFVYQSGNVEKHQVYKPVYKMTYAECEAYMKYINNIDSDEKKIIEFNKNNYLYNYYGIVDKKTCTLKIYDKSGKVIDSYVVGVGETIGDGRPQIALHEARDINSKNHSLVKYNKLSPAGHFVLDESSPSAEKPCYKSDKDGKVKIMSLKGDNCGMDDGQEAIHMTYKPEYEKRSKAIRTKTLTDNRMSFGCINLLEEDYDRMHSYLQEGHHLYILPEEDGNKLQLIRSENGIYKFEQIHHKDDPRAESIEESSKVYYNIHPENRPAVKYKEREDSLNILREQYPNILFY